MIHDNTIQGSTLFPLQTSLKTGPLAAGGFGIVTAECLGAVNHSNGVVLFNNLFAKNSNAGGWFCSDGTGGFSRRERKELGSSAPPASSRDRGQGGPRPRSNSFTRA